MSSVLIVDDSMVMRKTLRSILEKEGYIIAEEAVDGEDAVAKYKSSKPDFVTMDINMPKKDGIEAVKEIKAIDPKARIVMISSLDEKELVVDAIKSGAKYYILKPVTEEKIREVMQKLAVG